MLKKILVTFTLLLGLSGCTYNSGGITAFSSDMNDKFIAPITDAKNKENNNSSVSLDQKSDDQQSDKISLVEPAKPQNQIRLKLSENEPNNDFKTATLMHEKLIYHGRLLRNKKRLSNPDRDFYKLKIEQDGVLELVFDKTNKCNGKYGGYEISLHDGSISKLIDRGNKFLMRSYRKDEGFRKTIGLKKGAYFVKITAGSKCLINEEYKLYYSITPTKYTELEPNDRVELATPINIDEQEYHGRMQTNSPEIDYFSFGVPAKKEVIFTLNQPNFTTFKRSKNSKKQSLAYFTVKIYDDKDDRVGYFLTKKNMNMTTQHKVQLLKGKYYFKISGMDFSGRVGSSNSGTKYLEYSISLSYDQKKKGINKNVKTQNSIF